MFVESSLHLSTALNRFLIDAVVNYFFFSTRK